jgi:hypothetical protein
MLSWRGKLLLLGTVYLGGFVTAVYCLAPPSGVSREVLAARQASLTTTPSERVLGAIRVVVRKAREAGQDLVDRATVLIECRTRPEPSPNAAPSDKS